MDGCEPQRGRASVMRSRIVLRRLIRLCALLRGPGAVALAFALLCAPRRGEAQTAAFTDVTPPIMLDTYWSEGVAWGDVDNDGDLDLLVSNEGQYLRLFRNDGGVFTLATPAGLSAAGNWTGIAWGDVDNDGDIDLLAAEAERPKHLYLNNGAGGFTELPVAALADSAHTHGVSWVDFDRDGDLDIFLARAESVTQSYSPLDKLIRNDGGGAFSDVTPAALLDPQYGRGCSWADYDNDGDPDLCVGNFGTSRLFRNDGGGNFTDATPAALAVYGHAGGIAWGDYDNDGDFDLFVAEAYSSVNRLLRNDGGGAFTNVSTPIVAPVENCIGVQWGDYDNDADLDLYVANFEGPNHLFRNDGGMFTDVANVALADPHHTLGLGWADYDGDGDLDLYLANNFGEPDRLLRNDLAAGTHWLQLDLEGVLSNRSAIDARVEVVTGGVRQLRRVDGGGGYNSQNTLRVHFGLGVATVIDTLRIRWPSGIVQDSLSIPANQTIRIRERNTRLAVDAPAAAAVRLWAPSPNPFAASLAIAWELPRAMTVGLDVIDLQGRAVRTLASRSPTAAGRHEVSWDGRDDAGLALAAGVYFVRLTTPLGAHTRRVAHLCE